MVAELEFNSNDFQVIAKGNLVAKSNILDIERLYILRDVKPDTINITSLKTGTMKVAKLYHHYTNDTSLYKYLKDRFGWKPDIDESAIGSIIVYQYDKSNDDYRDVIFFVE